MKKNKILLLEILIWLLLITGLSFIAINSISNKYGVRPKYSVTFKDVDGLIVGSPVRVMGIQCGNVTSVLPKDDHVYVSFIITHKGVDIPVGSKASIQFTGLAGSKSLEILPPQEKVEGKELFYAVEPIRINSLFEVQAKISESILVGSKNMYSFFGKEDDIKKNIKAAKTLTHETLNTIDSTYDVLYSSNSLLSKGMKDINGFLYSQNQNFDDFLIQYYGLSADKKIKKTFTGVDYSLYMSINRDVPHKYLMKSVELNRNTSNIQQKTSIVNQNNSFYAFQFLNNGINKIKNFVNDICDKLSGKTIDKVNQKTEKVKIKTKKLKDEI